ncbi:MAG: FtsX-like permease family protein [Anaerolineae bacterium]|nr:FtsX-like permease family protein [Anaerolineae bacterium]
MSNLRFYLRHALNNMNRNRQRTLFVLFCIAAGVAAVVSLRTLGVMIGDAVTGNLQSELRGDMTITPGFSGGPDFAGFGNDDSAENELIEPGGQFQPATFSDIGIERITAWADENGYAIAPAQRNSQPLQSRRAENPENAELTTLYFIDETNYPFYQTLEFVAPDNMRLADAYPEPTSIVISAKLSELLGVGVDDQIRLTGARDPFTVTAIVADTAEASLTNPQSLIIPFVYASYTAGETLFNRKADIFYVQLPQDADVSAVEETFRADFPDIRTRTTDDVREIYQQIADLLTRLTTTMGLVSLLIGGIGIVNTMVVVVRRRALEIGVLKTIGLQGRQITTMFMLEALLLGILGSFLGVLLGIGLTALLRSVGEQLASRTLPFTISPQAIVYGMILGVVITLVFGFLPTLSAGRVRPNVVLNPTDDSPIPPAGKLQTVLILGILTVIMGLVVGNIIGNYLVGVGATLGVVIALGVVLLGLWVLVLILSIVPSFGSIRLKLAQRAIGTQRVRTASTLLALIIGMGGLSVLLLFTQSVLNLIDTTFEQAVGGNILVVPQSYETTLQAQEMLTELPGIVDTQLQATYSAEIVAINGNTDMEALTAAARAIGEAQYNPDDDTSTQVQAGAGQGDGQGFDPVGFQLGFLAEQLTLQKLSDGVDPYTVSRGEDITPDSDRGLVLQASDASDWFGLDVGDELTFRYNTDEEVTLTIAGIIANPVDAIPLQLNIAGAISAAIVSDNAVPDGVEPETSVLIVDAEPDRVDDTVIAISEIPGVFVFETSLINSFITAIVDQLTALPMVVAILALFASGVIIANTVSLATLERSREIGIMKALGLRTNQVLSLLLLENGLVGLLGGLIGVALGSVLALALVIADIGGDSNYPVGTALALIALALGIAIGATLITAIGASREKPLVVLRYE